jgi:hypothetical protein
MTFHKGQLTACVCFKFAFSDEFRRLKVGLSGFVWRFNSARHILTYALEGVGIRHLALDRSAAKNLSWSTSGTRSEKTLATSWAVQNY